MHALVYKFSFRSCFPAYILSKEVRLTTGSCSALELVKDLSHYFESSVVSCEITFKITEQQKYYWCWWTYEKKNMYAQFVVCAVFFQWPAKKTLPLTVHKYHLHLISRLNSTVSKPYPCSHRSLARRESLGKKLNNWWKVLWRIPLYVHFFGSLNTPDLPQSRINAILNLAKINAFLIENDQSK